MLAVLVILGISVTAIIRFVLSARKAPRTVEPWGKEIEEAVNGDEAVPLCHHCLAPQTHNGWFCPECGATVGPYCNFMPYIYVFIQGEVLRAGVTGRMRRSPLIVIGYVLISLHMFSIVAPIYWFFLFRNLTRRADTRPESAPPSS
jgi:hypothetical protein